MSSSFYSSSGSSPDIYSSASDSASAASNSATQAAASLTEFKSLYMGSFQSAPTATQDGSLYYNEVTNLLYYWNSVAWTATNTSAANTDAIAEGSANLYFTSERVDDRVNALLQAGSNVTLTYDDVANTLTIASTGGGGANLAQSTTDDLAEGTTNKYFNGKTTSDLAEGTNLYFTNTRATSAITGGDLDMGGNKVLFANMYSAEGNLPSASTYHGMFAHVHGTGKGYFAHGNAWHKLLDETSSTTTDLTEGSNLYYTDERVDDRVNALLTAGSNISLTYNDAANTLTIASTGGGGSGSSTFIGLTDTPASLGTSGQMLAVNSGGTALEFVAAPSGGGSGSSTFTGLTDTPSSFTASKFVAVNSGGTALEYVNALTPTGLTVTNNAASGGGSLSYVPSGSGNSATLSFIPPDLSGYATTASLSSYLQNINSESLSDLSNVASTAPSDGQVLTYDTTNGWQPETPASGGGGSVNYIASDSTGAATASNTTTLAVGDGAVASALRSLAVGYGADATASWTSSFGHFAEALAESSTALGYDTNVSSTHANSIALGRGATTTAARQLMLGIANTSTGLTSIQVGNTSYTPSNAMDLTTKDYVDTAVAGSGGIALTDLSASNGLAGNASLSYNNSTGQFVFTPPDLSTYITATSTTTFTNKSGNISQWTNDSGYLTSVPSQTLYDLSNVYSSSSPSDGQVLTWDNTNSYWKPTTVSAGSSFAGADYFKVNPALVSAASATGSDAISIGRGASNPADYSVLMGGAGFMTSAGDYGLAIGWNANVSAVGGQAVGTQASVGTNENYSMALGYQAQATAANQLVLGSTNSSFGYSSILVGNSSYAPTNAMDLTTKGYVDARNLADLANVNNTAPTDGQVLTWDNANSYWKPATASGGSGGGITGIAFDSYTTASSVSSGSIFSMAIGGDAYADGVSAIAIGYEAEAEANRTISIGYQAGYSTSTDQTGIAIGDRAHTNGQSKMPVAIGYRAQATGYGGVVVGSGESNYYSQAGIYGTSMGYASYAGQTSCAFGKGSYAPGNVAVCVGGDTTATQSNSVAIGYQASSTAANKFVLGNSSINDLRCQDTGISAVSDHRDKTQIEALTIGLDFVNAIEPKAFYKNNRNEYYEADYTLDQLDADNTLVQSYTFNQSDYEAGTKKFEKREFGFVAQDVAAELPEAYSDARVSFAETDDIHGFDVQRFTPADMTPILWKALRELSNKHDQLQSDYDALLARVVALENA